MRNPDKEDVGKRIVGYSGGRARIGTMAFRGTVERPDGDIDVYVIEYDIGGSTRISALDGWCYYKEPEKRQPFSAVPSALPEYPARRDEAPSALHRLLPLLYVASTL